MTAEEGIIEIISAGIKKRIETLTDRKNFGGIKRPG